MPAKRASIALIALAIAAVATSAEAASFNCTKAKTPDEKATCANRSLSELDVKMAALFGVRMKLPMLMGSRGAAQDEQREFLVNRGTCGADAACIGAVYQQRIDEINIEIDAAMQDYCVQLGICG